MLKRLTTFAVASLLACSIAHAAPVSLMDEGFDTGVESWNLWGPGPNYLDSFSVEGWAGKSGNGVWLRSYWADNAAGFFRVFDSGFVAGDRLSFSSDFRREANARFERFEMSLDFLDENFELLASERSDLNELAADNLWVQRELSRLVPQGTAYVRVAMDFDAAVPPNDQMASAMWDNAQLWLEPQAAATSTVAEPASLLLAGSALALLGLRQRRRRG